MAKSPIAIRTLFASALTVVLTLIGVIFLFSYLDSRTRDRVMDERARLEVDSIQVVINDSYTLGDMIGLRKYLDTFSKLNSWDSGSLLDSQRNEIWKSEKTPPKGPNQIEFDSDIKTPSGGLIGRLSVVKNHTHEIEKWSEQRMLSLLGLAGIALIVLFIQSLTLFRILRPVADLTSEIRREAEQLNLKLTGEKGEDDIFLIKKWFSEVAISWHQEKERAAIESQFRAIGNLASQVAHDIRSPLSALNMVMNQLAQVPEAQRLIIRNSVNRINDIANILLQKSKEQKNVRAESATGVNAEVVKSKVELLPALVDSLVSEKRIQFRDKIGVQIEADLSRSYGAFVNINPTELKRTLSNLINNAVEAFVDEVGRVVVAIRKKDNNVVLTIADNGRGIPKHILAKLGEMGVTHGKEGTQSGSGLGVYHAKKTIESFGGSFEIESREMSNDNHGSTPSEAHHGTTFTLTFPAASNPKWFVEKLVLEAKHQVLSLDDDLSIHGIWQGRFQSASKEKQIKHLTFTSGEEFKSFVRESQANLEKQNNQQPDKTQFVYLVDYELLAQNQTGLEIVEELKIGSQAILVTSRYEELQIREKCEKLGVRLIPKGMAGIVPIEIQKPKELLDLVLIDNDREIIHFCWQSAAKGSGKKIMTLASKEEFLGVAASIDARTPIYIDVSLDDGVKGQDVAIEIHKLGFKEIHLATGYDADSIEVPSCVTSVIGKDPPW